MQLKIFRHLWGIDLPWEQAFARISSLGYAGIETLLPLPADESRFVDLAMRWNLDFIVTVHSQGSSPREHLQSLQAQAERAEKLKGRFIAAQTGSDAFDAADIKMFYSEALKIEAGTGIPITHETHRGRPMFNPWAAASIVSQFPTLKLVCDFSHWVCVCERIMDDCLPIIEQVARQTHHIHARVGYAQGAQVPDPRVAKYQTEVAAHERWWDLIWEHQHKAGFAESTLCPEFGPPSYLQTNPQSDEPAANLWDIVEWQTHRQRRRFANRFQ